MSRANAGAIASARTHRNMSSASVPVSMTPANAKLMTLQQIEQQEERVKAML